MAVHVLGVRHHSPACARLVGHTIEAIRPRFVLIEGPSDINDRIDELLLGHRLPIAIFSYAAGPEGSSASWSPLCDYSPEWVAIRAARAAGARPLFMDLPAWHEAFEGVKNRYSDRHSRAGSRIKALAERVGVADIDALWDHLFELPAPEEELAARLRVYFEGLRRDEPGDAENEAREAYMAHYIAWAAAACEAEGGGDVVVVSGGYHAPALEDLWERVSRDELGSPVQPPALPIAPAGVRAGSYLVPYSFHRLDSFVGYEAGMPSPAFYQAVWEMGPEEAARAMMFRAIERLRARKQLVSPADAIAASTVAEGLKSLRGHAALARVDVLDGLAGALVKDALEAPLPWSRRGALLPRTDPLLVEIVAAFSGDRVGSLAPSTPRPPLVDDAFTRIAEAGIPLGQASAALAVPLTEPPGLAQSRVLHRLRVLEIPGFSRVRGPSFGRGSTDLTEGWTVARALDADAALIEASVYGATLEAAAAGRIEEMLLQAADLGAVAALLLEAALAGIGRLTARLLAEVKRIVWAEPSLGVLGRALEALLALYRHDTQFGTRGSPELAVVIEAAFDRGLWLVEGLRGSDAALPKDDLAAVIALRDALLDVEKMPAAPGRSPIVERARAEALMRRRARDVDAPPALRGAALGFLWSAGADGDVSTAEAEAIASLRAASMPAILGDYLAGLFALAREEVQRARSLLAATDAVLAAMTEADFLIAIPSLRLAFSYFPPLEKERIARAVLAIHGGDPQGASSLLRLTVDAEMVLRGRSIDHEVAASARRFGLDDSAPEEGP